MNDFEHETVSMDDLRAGLGQEILEEAEVIIAVDADSHEEVVHGETDWQLAVATGQAAELWVVRIELDALDDVDELLEMIAAARSGAVDEDLAEEPTGDDDD